MKPSITVSGIVLTFVASLGSFAQGQLNEPGSRNWTDEIQQSAASFHVFENATAKEPLKAFAAYKWRNPARPVNGDRLCMLYLKDGRPVASCKIYPTGQSIVHTPISFTDLRLVARQTDRTLWSPPESAIEFKRLTKTKPPIKTRAGRGVQLGALAREFAAETGPGEATRQRSVPQLRLLPKPIYRYKLAKEGTRIERSDGTGGEIFDGAVFTFVANGGNPQLLLLIEAVREKEESWWRYGISRRTIGALKVSRNREEVWSVEAVSNRDLRQTATFHRIVLPVGDDEGDDQQTSVPPTLLGAVDR